MTVPRGIKNPAKRRVFVLVGIAICGGAIAFNECNASLVQIVWGHFNADAFANVYPDARLAHFATYSCQNFMTVFQFYTKHCVW